MKIIDTKTHGYMDYIMGVFLIASPSLFSLEYQSLSGIVLYISGIITIVYSVLTRYELGFIRIIPMKIHLLLDFLSGILLAFSPWIFGFAETVYAPHLTLGIIEIIVTVLTKMNPTREIDA